MKCECGQSNIVAEIRYLSIMNTRNKRLISLASACAVAVIFGFYVVQPALAGVCYSAEAACYWDCPSYNPADCSACNPDSPYYDPCKQYCPGFGPCLDEYCKQECGGCPCASQSDYCDNPPDAGPGGGNGGPPGSSGGGGCRFRPCERGSLPGSVNCQNGSIRFRFGLGLLPDGYQAPSLWVHRWTPHPSLSTPASLHIAARKRESSDSDSFFGFVEVPGLIALPNFTSPNLPPVRQVITPQAFVNIVTKSDYKYYIIYYDPQGMESWETYTEGNVTYYMPQGTPYSSYVIENPDASSTVYNRIFIQNMARVFWMIRINLLIRLSGTNTNMITTREHGH